MITTFKLNEEGKCFNILNFSNEKGSDNIVFVLNIAYILLAVNNIIQ